MGANFFLSKQFFDKFTFGTSAFIAAEGIETGSIGGTIIGAQTFVNIDTLIGGALELEPVITQTFI